jgi:3-hydroxyacyl-[acyl-carrier-protein] dehydratase
VPDLAVAAAPAVAEPPLRLEHQAVRRLLPHRYPMLLVDRVESLEPGVAIEAVKCVSSNEPFLVGHFPDYPIMPGVLLVDALAQAAGIMLRSGPSRTAAPVEAEGGASRPVRPGVLASIPKMRFLRPVLPGDRVILRARLVRSFGSTHRVSVEALVEGVRAAVGELVLSS